MDKCDDSRFMILNEKSKWIIRMEMIRASMLEKNINMDDINFAIRNSFKDEVHVYFQIIILIN